MAYIGHSPSTGEDNNFKILDDISSYTLTFDGSDSSVVSTSDETIYSYNHRFVQGQRVRYTNGGGGDINVTPGVECLSLAISFVTLKPGNCPPSPGLAP